MGRPGRDQVAEKLQLAAWLVGSRLTLDTAVSLVAGIERHAEELRDLLPPSRRQPAWAQHTTTYIEALTDFVLLWHRRFSDESAVWDEARPRFLADVEHLREARAVLVDYLAGRPHLPAAAVVDDPDPEPADVEPAPIEQRQEPEPVLVDDDED